MRNGKELARNKSRTKTENELMYVRARACSSSHRKEEKKQTRSHLKSQAHAYLSVHVTGALIFFFAAELLSYLFAYKRRKQKRPSKMRLHKFIFAAMKQQ